MAKSVALSAGLLCLAAQAHAAAAPAALVDPDQAAILQGSLSLLQHGHQARRSPTEMALAGQKLRRSAEVPHAVIDLDLPPEKRWYDFYVAHRDLVLELAPILQDVALQGLDLARDINTQRDEFMKNIDFSQDQELKREYAGIVDAINDSSLVNESVLLWREFGYEHAVTMGCTGIVAAAQNGNVIHGRNLDLSVSNELQRGTIDITFFRGGKALAHAAGFLGMVGLHTLYRINGWSLAQNTRSGVQDVHANKEAARSGGRPFTFMARHAMEDIDNFEAAVQHMASVPLMAPQYFTMAGPGSFEGALVTRDRAGTEEPFGNVLVLSPQINRWYIVQTNDDLTGPAEDDRRPTALTAMATLKPESVDSASVKNVLMMDPVHNGDTVFTWLVDLKTGLTQLFLGDEHA